MANLSLHGDGECLTISSSLSSRLPCDDLFILDCEYNYA